MPSDNACLAQAASVGESAFNVYNWYGRYQDEVAKGLNTFESNVQKAWYATVTLDSLLRMVEALNGGGCYKFSLTIEDFAEWINFNQEVETDAEVVAALQSEETNDDVFWADGQEAP